MPHPQICYYFLGMIFGGFQATVLFYPGDNAVNVSTVASGLFLNSETVLTFCFSVQINEIQ